MKLFSFFVLLIASSVSLAEELIEIRALDEKISILAPKDFGAMPIEMLEIKYPTSSRPTEVLSDSTGSVSLAFNHTNNAMKPSQVKIAHKSISKIFHNWYPSATWIRDEVIEKNGHTFIVMELVTPAIDTQIHNIIYGTSVDDRFLLAAFNTTVEKSGQWLPVGKKIMESLSIK